MSIDGKNLYNGPVTLEMADREADAAKGRGTVEGVLAGNVHAFTAEDRATALRLARAADTGLPFRSWRYAYWWWIVITTCVCAGDSGFDGTIMSAINSMEQYQKFFGLAEASAGTGLVFGIFNVGGVVSAICVTYLPDKFGRKISMFIGNLVLIVGAVISSQSQNKSMFLGGRFLTGLGSGIASNVASAYMAEITSPASRGRYVGGLNSTFHFGQILASGIAVPLGRIQSEWSWRTPMLVQMVPALINIAFVLWIPESPRWLYSRGKRDKAVQILAKLHSRDNDIGSPLIQLEIQEIEANISLNGADKRWWDFKAVFRSRNYRYRFYMTILVAIWGNVDGQGLVVWFLPILLRDAGITNSNKQRELNLVNSFTATIASFSGVAWVDFFGRRSLMLTSLLGVATCQIICGTLLSPVGKKSSSRTHAGIAFIYMFQMCFSFAWTPLQSIYPAEVLAFDVRLKGLALHSLNMSMTGCINTFGLPVALEKLGYKVYFIFVCTNILGAIVVWFFAPETKQLSLEDIDEIFDAQWPMKRSKVLAREAKVRAAEEGGQLGLS